MRPFRIVPLVFALGVGLGIVTPAHANERWVRVESPYFTLYAECDASDARAWAVCFDQFRRYVSEFIRVAPTQLQPLTIVLFRNRQEFLRYVAPRNGKTPTDLTSETVTYPTGTIIITSLNWEDSETRESFYAAGTYWFLGGFKYGGPDWFRVGLAETFKTFSVTNDEIRVGMSPDGDVLYLRDHHLMPLPQLFGISVNGLDFQGDRRTTVFFAESWALVHRLTFGRDRERGGKSRAPELADFMEALQNGEPTEPAFRRVFGTDYDGMIRQLESYVTSGRYSIVTGKFNRTVASANFSAQAETDAGTEIIHGYAYLGANRSEDARRHFLIAQAMPGGELRAEEALGDLGYMTNNDSEAKGHYIRAIELGTRSYRPFYFLGNQVMGDEIYQRTHLPHIEAHQARLAASRFEQAINNYPRYILSFERLALLMPSLETFSEDDRKFLELGMQVSPGNDLIEAGLGVWEMRNHQMQRGQERLRSLVAAGRQPSPWSRLIVQEVADAEAAGEGLTAARKLLAEGKTDEAGQLIQKLLNDSTDESQRTALVALQLQVGLLDLVMQAEKLADTKEWDAAESIAQNVVDAKPSAELAQRAEAVLARVKARK